MNLSKDTEENKMYCECIKLQLDEVDMLSSIYCSPGEFKIYDPGVISDFNDFINSLTTNLPSTLDYGLLMSIPNNKNIEIKFHLPHLYPLMENAIVNVESAFLSKNLELHIRKSVEEYINGLEKSEPYAFQVITYINDNIDDFMKLYADNVTPSTEEDSCRIVRLEFERLWIYSHHIKSSTKRQEIVRSARDLELTGFCRPGKPGIICVEGQQTQTQEFWKIIKSMKWQKITIRKSEVKLKPLEEFNNLRRWTDFKETIFTDIGDQKLNMGLFIKYLEDRNCGYIKNELFRLD